MADHVVIVYQIGRVSRSALGRTKLNLDNVNANIIGVVLNDTKAELNKFSHGSEYSRPYYGDGAEKQFQGAGIGRAIEDISKGRILTRSVNYIKDKLKQKS